MFLKKFGKIGNNIHNKTYPRIVGETGGKDFIVAHPSANAKQVVTGITVMHLNFKVKMFCSFNELISAKFMARRKSNYQLM
jgi:acyl-CoA reductase-like NAD-dependent aldehyde dehydrogenase